MSRLLAMLHTLVILLFMVGIFWWLEIARLNQYSLQLMAILILVYFLIKRINQSRIWQLLPTAMSIEIALTTAGFLLLIGSTGNLSSIFFPLVYVNLFFLVFASHTGTAIFATFGEVLFHFAMASQPTPAEISSLLSLPLFLVMLIFAKHQYQQSNQRKAKLAQEDELLNQEEQEVAVFIQTFLKPKLASLQSLIEKNKARQSAMEVDQIAQELESLENHLAGYLQEHEEVEPNEGEDELQEMRDDV